MRQVGGPDGCGRISQPQRHGDVDVGSGQVDVAGPGRTGTVDALTDACDPLPPGSLTAAIALIRRAIRYIGVDARIEVTS